MIDFYALISGANDHIGVGWRIFGWVFLGLMVLFVRPRGR